MWIFSVCFYLTRHVQCIACQSSIQGIIINHLNLPTLRRQRSIAIFVIKENNNKDNEEGYTSDGIQAKLQCFAQLHFLL